LVARRYYLDGKQMNEVAEEFGLSRFKVGRLLNEAREKGIVHISIEMPAEVDFPLGELLASQYEVGRCIVVRSEGATGEALAAILGAGAAQYLSGIISAEDTLGISWGETLTSVVDSLGQLPPAAVVQLVGGAHAADLNSSGVELIRRLAAKTSGVAAPLHSPLIVGSVDIARQLRSDPSLTATFSRYDTISVALVGIGSWNPSRSSLLRELPTPDRDALLAKGAIADICTFVFDSDGQELQSPALERTIGITSAQLRSIREVVAVAGGQDKIDAIRAALRSGLIDTLVTDSTTARALISAGL